MRQIVIGITITLTLAGMLASDAEAAAQCCRLSGRWLCGTLRRRDVVSSLVDGSVPVPTSCYDGRGTRTNS